MSQLDPIDALHAARRPVAPDELRERVREIAAASSPPPTRRLTWRRASFALVPALGVLVVAALVLGNRNGDRTAATPEAAIDVTTSATSTTPTIERSPVPFGVQRGTAAGAGGAATNDQKTLGVPLAPAPTPGRVVRYSSYLELRIRTADGVARAAQSALRTARSLGGYPTSTTIDAQGRAGSAELVLRIPRAHVQEAVTRLSALGTIVGEHVSIQDLQAGLNASDRTVARLQKRLRDLRALPQTDPTRRAIAATTARIAKLQRASGSTTRAAHFATVELQLHTPRRAQPAPHHRPGHGPLHGLGVAFRWIGIGAVYALALGGPLVLLGLFAWLAARTVRRRREAALLAQR